MTDEIRQKILDEVDSQREEIVELLITLVRIPSVTGDEGEIQNYIAGYLRDMGLEPDVWESDWEALKKHPEYVPVTRGYEGRPNVVSVLKGSGGGKSLLLNGHTDTVPNGPPDAWEHGPLSADVVDGRLYGRGSSDMKSGVAAIIMAAKCFLDAGLRPKGDVILDFVVDEELSGHGTLDTILRGYTADAGICCETSENAVQPGCIGRIWFEILVRGKAAGIQRRYEGINAIDLGYKIVQAVADLEKKRLETVSHPLYPNIIDAIPCMVGSMEAGSFPSAFPDTCLLKGSLATVPGEDHDAAKQSLVDQVAEAAQGDPWMKDHPPEVKFVGYYAESAAVDRDHPIVKTVAGCYEEVSGKTPEISGRQGAADTRFLNGFANIPTVIFGPGPTTQMHANNEWVAVDDVIDATKTLALSIMDWCGAEMR
ncbi:MAG: ArgE/DapE family deacylase [Nitrospinaceae bacterium]|nr:ArgE/DapE family deacylase [Nitrospinaceae bacterium]MBT3433999.1 ArgE/DapE family deacylase [Nitrospinaceae bacterium]MBT3820358.1 ArgE/DapE family deacylase [Nitrospinaceae bacterium]MBT4432608.1 ArgE/DapE family deacylase [Nitrospinaceae bacterium]MBT5366607.1 ArgE/DapE family deacylase [Nitrospinaceae bacterium]